MLLLVCVSVCQLRLNLHGSLSENRGWKNKRRHHRKKERKPPFTLIEPINLSHPDASFLPSFMEKKGRPLLGFRIRQDALFPSFIHASLEREIAPRGEATLPASSIIFSPFKLLHLVCGGCTLFSHLMCRQGSPSHTRKRELAPFILLSIGRGREKRREHPSFLSWLSSSVVNWEIKEAQKKARSTFLLFFASWERKKWLLLLLFLPSWSEFLGVGGEGRGEAVCCDLDPSSFSSSFPLSHFLSHHCHQVWLLPPLSRTRW